MIGDRIKELRIRNNFTQTDLARRLQLSRSAINAWEMGISVPSTQYIVELANLFKTSADYLLEINSEETINISCLDHSEKELLARLLEYFSKTKILLEQLEKHSIEINSEDLEDLCGLFPEHFRKLQKSQNRNSQETIKISNK